MILTGWTNVDFCSAKADLVADIRTMEVDRGSCDELLCVHVIEHLARDEGVRLVKRCTAWLKPGGILVIEAPCYDKCVKLTEAKNLKTQLTGVKGLLGGRSFEKEKWKRFMSEWWETYEAPGQMIPELPGSWNVPGENHVYVWRADELLLEFKRFGLAAGIESPMFHGKRKHRDFRIVGMKRHVS